MSKILYLNQKLLSDPRLSTVLASYNYNWNQFNKLTQLNPGNTGGYVRAGVNIYPLKNELINQLNFQMPVYDSAFALSFSDVTDKQLMHLYQTRWNKRWLVLWSGGIDSTVIVASILKNLSPADRSNVDIACNRISIYENPKFYYEHILPNFKLIDSNFLNLDDLLFEKYYVIDGEPADQLYGGIASRGMIDPNTVLKSWRNDPDELLDFFTNEVDRPFAEWYYESTKENIDSVTVPVETYYDFTWWLFFNMTWSSILLRPLHFQLSNSVDSLTSYFTNVIPYFNTIEYQLWSMTNRIGIKYNAGIGERKLASKKYIYDFDHDEYYFCFKTKAQSVSRPTKSGRFFCILDDYTRLTLSNDLDQILELLPEHISVR